MNANLIKSVHTGMIALHQNPTAAAGTRVTHPDPFQQISADFVHATSVSKDGLEAHQTMLVPGCDVAALALDLPRGLRGQNREQVARRQLRDQIGIAADSAEMRPFQTRTSGESWSRVLVADRALIDAWRAQAGTSCHAVLPDYLALPSAPRLWTLSATPNGVAARLGPDDGFGAPSDTALALLDLALRKADPAPHALLRIGPALPQFETLFETRGIPVVSTVEEAAALAGDAPLVLGYGEAHMDLRRDPQMARAVLARQVLPWRWPLVFGMIAAGLWATSQMIVTDRIVAETAAFNTATTALVREHFVRTGPILDARIQVSQALAKMQSDTTAPVARVDPIQLLNRTANIVAALGAQTRSASYAGDETLDLVLQVADFAAAEQVGLALKNAGLDVIVRDTRVSDGADTVRTELRVSPNAGPAQ
jgi:general secretion pathway protein L